MARLKSGSARSPDEARMGRRDRRRSRKRRRAKRVAENSTSDTAAP